MTPSLVRALIAALQGFEHTPTTADRRLFTKHVRKMRNEGLIEVVAVPGVGGFTTRCLRLAEFRPQGGESFEVDNPYAMNSGFAKADMESGQDADNLDVDLDMGDGRESRGKIEPDGSIRSRILTSDRRYCRSPRAIFQHATDSRVSDLESCQAEWKARLAHCRKFFLVLCPRYG